MYVMLAILSLRAYHFRVFPLAGGQPPPLVNRVEPRPFHVSSHEKSWCGRQVVEVCNAKLRGARGESPEWRLLCCLNGVIPLLL